MTPEGPYRSPWAPGDWFLVSTVQRGQIVYAVVRNGQQASEGTLFPSSKEARQYLKDNGFTKS